MARKLQKYADISLIAEELSKPVDFEKVFGRSGPVEIEIGSGRGTFVVNQALAKPGVNFLGIEWASKFCRYAVDRLGRWQVRNAKMLRADAIEFIEEYVAEESVDIYHIYFPDPWPKKKHHKRRMLSSDNVKKIVRTLKPCGVIQAATDHDDYFEQIKRVFEDDEDLEIVPFTCAAGAQRDEFVGTNYERKYLEQGRSFKAIAARKVAR